MGNCLDILNSFFRGEYKYYVPEIEEAFEMAGAPKNNRLIIKLKKRLESMSASEWPVYAQALVHVFADAETQALKICCFRSVLLRDDPPHSGAGPKRSWGTEAKKTAIRYLSAMNSRRAADVIAQALKFEELNEDAARALQKTVYGRMLLSTYAGTEKDPCSAASQALPIKEPADPVLKPENEKPEDVKIINYQPERTGRIKHKYLRRKIWQNPDGSASFRCLFCGASNTVKGERCRHAVYGYETANHSVIDADGGFLNAVIKSISADPSKFIEGFDRLLSAYLESQDTKNDRKAVIDLDGLKEILANRITPGVLDAVFEANGIPDTMKSLAVYSLDDTSGGTYYYAVSDEDLEKMSAADAEPVISDVLGEE
ncbi:MAG: hypothetical protein ACYCWE_15250 [Eubacteriales bacterium]